MFRVECRLLLGVVCCLLRFARCALFVCSLVFARCVPHVVLFVLCCVMFCGWCLLLLRDVCCLASVVYRCRLFLVRCRMSVDCCMCVC